MFTAVVVALRRTSGQHPAARRDRVRASVYAIRKLCHLTVLDPLRSRHRRHPDGVRLRVHALRRPASGGARGHRGAAGGGPVPLRERAAGLDRGRRLRPHHRRRLRRQRDHGRHHAAGRRPEPHVPGGRAARHAAHAGARRGVDALRPDHRGPDRHPRAPAGTAAAFHPVAGAAGVDHAVAHPARRRPRRVLGHRSQPVPPALDLRRRGATRIPRPW